MLDDVDRAGVLIDEECALPGPSTIRRLVHTTLLLRTVAVALRGHPDDVGIRRVDHDPADASGGIESHVRPRASGIGGLVDAVADRDVASNERLAGARPDDVRIRWRTRERADR